MSRPPRHTCSPAEFVRSAWGLTGIFSPLAGDVNENWRFEADSGALYMLRVSAPDIDLAELAALGRVQAELAEERWPVPEPVSVQGGTGHGRWVTRADHRPEGGWASLQTWVAGELAGDIADLGSRYPARLGRFLARLDRSLAEFDEPALQRTHAWDVLAIEDKLTQLDAIENAERRARLRGWIEHFSGELLPSLRARPKTLIHGDANDYNVLVSPDKDGQHSIVGIVDFADALLAPRVLEPAIAAAYVALSSRDAVRSVGELIESYTGDWPLDLASATQSKREIALCMRMRIVQTAITAAVNSRAARSTTDGLSDDYATVHAASAWALLDGWDAAGWDQIQ